MAQCIAKNKRSKKCRNVVNGIDIAGVGKNMNFERNEGGFMVGVSFILRTVYFEAYRINYKVKTISSKGEMKISLNLNVSAKEMKSKK